MKSSNICVVYLNPISFFPHDKIMDEVERLILNILICVWIEMVLSMAGGMIWVVVKYNEEGGYSQNVSQCNDTQ